jgi:ornithine cyclodeaminase
MSALFLPAFDADAVARALDYPTLIAALREGFRDAFQPLPRAIHNLDDPSRTLFLMPAVRRDAIAVKIATVVPDNPARRDLPVIHALVVLFDGETGEPVAVADGTEITLRRTAAASALAASYLARDDAATLLMIGTGALVPYLIEAHVSVRPIRRVEIWGRSPAKAEAAARRARERTNVPIGVAADIAASAARADVISCATSSPDPVLRGQWLKPGTHVDLVGSFSPDTREADDNVMRIARIFVDTRAGALSEAGDVLIPLANGTIGADGLGGELAELCRGTAAGRTRPDEVTVFKSVGAALEDLIAVRTVLAHGRRAEGRR